MKLKIKKIIIINHIIKINNILINGKKKKIKK